MNKEICLAELFAILQALGHHQFWMNEYNHLSAPLYCEICSWDQRVIAWWDEQGSSWILTEEVLAIVSNPGGVKLQAGAPLSREECFHLSLLVTI
ncbi:hypothetical protein [Rahnella victoriana]|uniref:hypothetical protein n=1 Tax=Rahnella victoriana TaxID=1510570 RepID=UPI001E5F23C6|nr:hypothetical protein [Rahnella victoriana]UHM93658.1 hypothetical protein J9880_24725 [Rahnella victoriana]